MIRLDYRDARPIYEQVRDGLRSLMVTGVLAAGEKLPSVRSLATELAINPNTIQRAYSQLETEGYCHIIDRYHGTVGIHTDAVEQTDISLSRTDVRQGFVQIHYRHVHFLLRFVKDSL